MYKKYNPNYVCQRIDGEFYLEVRNGNPNGDPGMDNCPRMDFETGIGYINDAAIKHHLRQSMAAIYENTNLFMREGSNLTTQAAKAKEAAGFPIKDKSKAGVEAGKQAALDMYDDVRSFGAVMSGSGADCGHTKGTIQFRMGESVDPITPVTVTITRCAVSKDVAGAKSSADYEKWEQKEDESSLRTMGTKRIIPFGLYRIRFAINPDAAQKNHFTLEDQRRFFEALQHICEFNDSSIRGEEYIVGPIIVFQSTGLADANNPENEHSKFLGCGHGFQLYDLVNIKRKDNVKVARHYTDYDATIKLSALPRGIRAGTVDMNGNFDWEGLEYDNWMRVI